MPTPNQTDPGGLAARVLLARLRQRPVRVGSFVAALVTLAAALVGLAVWAGG